MPRCWAWRPGGPAGVLRRAGESGQLTLALLSEDTVDDDSIPIAANQIESGQTIDWASEKAALQPSTIPTAAWNVIWTNLIATVGTSTDSYNAALTQAATYLGGLGGTTAQVSDVGRLWSFLVSQADAEFPTAALTSAVDASLSTPGHRSLGLDRTFVSSISGRFKTGIFGLGWVSSWQTSPSIDGSGNVSINKGGESDHYFRVQPNGNYLDTDGEFGSLTDAGGIFTFTDVSATKYAFLPKRPLELRARHQSQPHRPGLQRPKSTRHVDLFQSGRPWPGAGGTTQFDLQHPGIRVAGGRRHRQRLELHL